PGLPRAPGYRGQLQLQPQLPLPCDPVPEPPPPIGGSVIGGSQVARRSSSFSTSRFRCFMMPPPFDARSLVGINEVKRRGTVATTMPPWVPGRVLHWSGAAPRRQRAASATPGPVVAGVPACHARHVTAVTGARLTSAATP